MVGEEWGLGGGRREGERQVSVYRDITDASLIIVHSQNMENLKQTFCSLFTSVHSDCQRQEIFASSVSLFKNICA